MRKALAVALLVCIAAGLAAYFLFHRERPPENLEAAKVREAPRAVPQPTHPTPGARTNSPPAPASTTVAAHSQQTKVPAADLAPSVTITGPLLFGGPESKPVQLPPDAVVDNVRIAIRSYGSMFEGNPVGTNPEITAALNGENPKGVRFLDPDKGMRVNTKGELVDSWGTPFFFHQLSGAETEIRSAGPDKQMWTADDLILK